MMKVALVVCVILAFAATDVYGDPDKAVSKECYDSGGRPILCPGTEESYSVQYELFVNEYTEKFKDIDEMLDKALAVSSADAGANFLSKITGRFGDCFKVSVSMVVEIVKRGRGTVIGLLSHVQAGRVTTMECISTYGFEHPSDLGMCVVSNVWLAVKGGVGSQFQNLFNIVRDIFRDLIPNWFSTCFGSKE